MATVEKEIKITVVGVSAIQMMQEIETGIRTEKQEKFIRSLQGEVKEFEDWLKAGGH